MKKRVLAGIIITLTITLIFQYYRIPSSTDIALTVLDTLEEAFMRVKLDQQTQALAPQVFNNIRLGLDILSLKPVIDLVILVILIIFILKSLCRRN